MALWRSTRKNSCKCQRIWCLPDRQKCGEYPSLPTVREFMELLRKVWKWLNNEPRQIIGVRVLQIAVGAKLLFDIFTLLPFATFLWGPNGMGEGSTRPLLGPLVGNFFDHLFLTNVGVFCVITALVIGALWLLIGYN